MDCSGRSERKCQEPDLEALAGRLMFGVHGEVLAQVKAAGFDGVGSRHAGVVAYLDSDGVRPGDVATLLGRSKQTTGATLDELERLGYVARVPDPSDRRARLVVPTDRGTELAAAFDDAVAQIEARHRAAIGAQEYDAFVATLRRVVAAQRPTGATSVPGDRA